MRKLFYTMGCLLAVYLVSSCSKDKEVTYQAISVDFAVKEIGLEGAGKAEVEIGLKLSRAAKTDLSATVQMTPAGVPMSDIVLTPAPDGDRIAVPIPQGATTASFKVAIAPGRNPEGSIRFGLTELSHTEGYKIGALKETTLSFGSLLSTGSSMQLEGKVGSENYRNIVFVDLSENAQKQIDRKTWDLGFSAGESFRVILNTAYKTLAVSSKKTDFGAVTLADAEGAPSLLGSMMGDGIEGLCDDTSDPTKTLFGDIAANEAESQVFFVSSEDNKASNNVEDRSLWYKVKVTRTQNGYKVEYGNVQDTKAKTVEIPKNPQQNYVGLSLASGKQTEAGPGAGKWDFKWSYAAAWTTMRSGPMLSFSQDVITINTLGGVQVATVKAGESEDVNTIYKNYTLETAKAAKYDSKADIIGASWRTPVMPGAQGGITPNVYIIKDCDGNYYKLQFLTFGSGDSGQRGRPTLRYELLQ